MSTEPAAEEQERDPIEEATLQVVSALRSRTDADLATLMVEAFTPTAHERSLPQHVRAPRLTEAHQAALKRLPEVFGAITVSEPRALTAQEAATVIEERKVIDTLMSVLKKRKDETMREMLANHLDRVAEDEDLVDEDTETDAKGHYLLRHEAPVEGSGMKVQAIISEGQATIDSAQLQSLHQEGHLTRKEYLALTSVPEVPRVFDATKARAAIMADPSLLAKIAQATRKPKKTLTIKVVPDA